MTTSLKTKFNQSDKQTNINNYTVTVGMILKKENNILRSEQKFV